MKRFAVVATMLLVLGSLSWAQKDLETVKNLTVSTAAYSAGYNMGVLDSIWVTPGRTGTVIVQAVELIDSLHQNPAGTACMVSTSPFRSGADHAAFVVDPKTLPLHCIPIDTWTTVGQYGFGTANHANLCLGLPASTPCWLYYRWVCGATSTWTSATQVTSDLVILKAVQE